MKSPCIEVCRFDGKTGWCLGCGRTRPECREWKKAGRARHKAITHELEPRLARLAERGVRVGESA